jgi:outer membrane protein OmpA-like peptidoglycan-associated protein
MSEDVTKLKELLFENESRTLSDLTRRMDIVFERAGTPERFATSVATVLDEALRQAEIDRHAELSNAIAPLIVKTIKTEIRGSQDELAEALYPSLGRMVKAYVISAIRDLMDEINRRLEANRFMLRLRSLLTGRPVAELAFAEGQRLKIEEIFLIRRGSGALIAHWPVGEGLSPHDRRVSGILTAINEVATEAFQADQSALRRIDLGTSLIYLRASPAHLLAAKCSGLAPSAVEQVIDEHFLATIERLRALPNGGIDAAPLDRRVGNILAGLATRLEAAIAEQHAKFVRRRSGLSPAAVLLWGIGLALAAWAAWSAYTSYQTERVRSIAATILAGESALSGYPVHVYVERRGREVTLSGLVATPEAAQGALRRLREALPNSEIIDRTTALPGGLEEARADIGALQAALSELGSQSSRAEAALRTDIDGLHGEAKGLGAQISQANAETKASLEGLRAGLSQTDAARQADLKAMRSELESALAPTPHERLAKWIGAHAIFFDKDTSYRDPQAAAAALDELKELINATDVLVRVVGYTDEKGGEERNTPLSQARAEKVVADLSARGVPASRLIAVGRNDVEDLSSFVGDSSPNRRVEFEVAFRGEALP